MKKNIFQNYSWIKSRFLTILLVIFDFLILNYLFFILFQVNNFIDFIITFCYILISILFFYLSERYSDNSSIDFLWFFKDIKKTFFSFSISYLTIFIFYRLIFHEKLFFYNEIQIIEISLYFFLISNAKNLILKSFSQNFNLEKKTWIVLLQDKELNNMHEMQKFLGNKFNLSFDKDEVINLKNKKNIAGIIFDHKLIKKKKYEELKKICFKNKIRFLTFDEWNEKELNLFSYNFIKEKVNKNFLISKNLHINFKVKRIFDIVASLILLVIFFPLIVLISLIIKLEDKDSIFYRQKRNGLNNKTFYILKFRSMKKDAEKDGLRWSSINDKRVTRIGRFIRKYRIDELPQLISVLKGEMSLIGPRPERPEIDKNLRCLIPNYDLRYIFKPGLTGWAQVNYSYGASVNDAQNKLSFDLYYIKNFSIMLDLFIIIKTIKIILLGDKSLPI